jgi:hypothetical protein
MLDFICIIGFAVLLGVMLLPAIYVIVDTNLYILDDMGLIDREKWIKK